MLYALSVIVSSTDLCVLGVGRNVIQVYLDVIGERTATLLPDATAVASLSPPLSSLSVSSLILTSYSLSRESALEIHVH